jgi:hypothetical protein
METAKLIFLNQAKLDAKPDGSGGTKPDSDDENSDIIDDGGTHSSAQKLGKSRQSRKNQSLCC